MSKQISKKPAWGPVERQEWLLKQRIQRSYLDDVVSKLEHMKENFTVEQYGALSHAPPKYPLFIVKTRSWLKTKPTVLITGGVHGYETSGVRGAIRFLDTQALTYAEHFNIAVVPCVSPWGYETINRWNPKAIDPNRSFYPESPSEESAELMGVVAKLMSNTSTRRTGDNLFDLLAHIDLHETTDTDNTVFRPALAERDGIEQDIWSIPDGFYVVGDIENPAEEFQQAIIDSVKKVTHIALPDQDGKIIGEPITQEGVIHYATKKLGLCTGFTNSQYCSTTEVYPDSESATDEDCILAQAAAINGGLTYLLKDI